MRKCDHAVLTGSSQTNCSSKRPGDRQAFLTLDLALGSSSAGSRFKLWSGDFRLCELKHPAGHAWRKAGERSWPIWRSSAAVMVDLEIKRNGRTNQFSIVLVQGGDTIRCMVSITSGDMKDTRSDEEKEQAALRKAKALAQALDAAIGES